MSVKVLFCQSLLPGGVMVTRENLDLVFQVRVLAGQRYLVDTLRMSKALSAIILAAGKGVRMKSDLPKVLHAVAGKPMVLHVCAVAQEIGSLKTVVVVGHHAELVKQVLPKTALPVIQRQLLGTADAVKAALTKLRTFSGDVVILCGDTPLLRSETIKELIKRHRQTKSVCTVLTAKVPDPTGYGRIIRDPADQVLAIREHKDATEEEKLVTEINTGVYCFNIEQLRRGLSKIRLNEKKKEFYLTDIIETLVREEKAVAAYLMADYWEGLGVNNREELTVAEGLLRKRILQNLLSNGVGIVDPNTTYVAADAQIGVDTIIRPFTVIEENVRIGSRCVIGPFARLRPGTRIGNNVEVGNFAEVSRSQLGDGSRMKHFGFLGDALVGQRVNIGAGVVTANYDGKNKNLTVIKDDVFVGSDSILVAPVTIGKKAMTGAGSVVTAGKNVPDGKIAVGIPARILARRSKS